MIDSDSDDDGVTIDEKINGLINLGDLEKIHQDGKNINHRKPVNFILPGNKKIKLNKTVLSNKPDYISAFKRMNETILPNRLNMMNKPLSIHKNMSLQHAANPKSLYYLEKTDNYFLKNYVSHESILANGRYIFVISVNDPLTICCARTVLDSNYHWYDAVDGHTSIGNRQPVYFAGNLLFKQGILLEWSNASGHYKPPEDWRLLLSPYIRRLLPDSKFKSIKFVKNQPSYKKKREPLPDHLYEKYKRWFPDKYK
ncbi:hypothetical protein [Xenorhabdus bharatensis]|uniref:hypothetical protein n=1 Tax=Xenorhabdus bharatensis TaxID=3136256 RepID=UPI0030F3DBDC